jgi:anaerobic selenocysteine-containing dehydrogenase
MERITRRVFIKAAAGIGATLAVRKYTDLRKLNLTALCDSAEAAPVARQKLVTVVSDVDAHSQCKMKVKVEGDKVIHVAGDPTDPESKGHLTLRGKHMREILYAPDRLQYPVKRVGVRENGRESPGMKPWRPSRKT